MSFSLFKRNKKKVAAVVEDSATEVLYLSDETQAFAPASSPAGAASAPNAPSASGEPAPRKGGLFTAKAVEQGAPAAPVAPAPASEEVRLFECDSPEASRETSTSPSEVLPVTSAPAAKSDRKTKQQKSERKESKADIEAWRKGVKGRPSQVFVGFLASSSKSDAIKYAIGVAEHNAVNAVNAAYAVYPWNEGWAYEVQEGGPKRAYLPSILKFYDAHNEHAKGDDLVITIATGGRSVRVERSHAGLVAFMMPESFAGEQTPWLEPGTKLKAAVPVRMGVLAAGGALFATGFLAMLLALVERPDAPPLLATRTETRFEQLPVSQWPTLLSAASTGYVDSLEYSGGHWKISRARPAQEPAPTVTAPPPLPAPSAQGK